MNLRHEKPWVALREVCDLYGVTYETAKNKIHANTFEVPVYKVGKHWVIDKAVHAAYFEQRRTAGLLRLKSTMGG